MIQTLTKRLVEPTQSQIEAIASGQRGRLRSPVLGARTPAEVNAIIQTLMGQFSTDYTPSYLWHFDETATADSGYDYGGTNAHLVPNGASATRVLGDTDPNSRAAHQVRASTSAYWKVSDSSLVNFTTEEFAFVARARFNGVGSGGWWMSKGSNTATGYFAAGLDVNGFPSLSVRATDSSTAAASLGSNVGDSTWRWILLGRNLPGAVVWVHAGSTAQSPFAAAKSLDTTANFGLWFNLFGTPQGGENVDVDMLMAFRNTAAQSIYDNRINLFSALSSRL